MANTTNILIVGVGGQGIVLAGDIIGLAAQLSGLQVKASEVHGMSQRGGSVVSEVRFGREVFSPLIPPHETDYLLAFEALEGLRALPRLKDEGMAIVNIQRIIPSSVTYGSGVYPDDIENDIRMRRPNAILVDALKIAGELGNPRIVNSVLLGVLAAFCPIPFDCWEKAFRQLIKPKFIDINLSAFAQGRELPMAEQRR